MKLKLRPEKPKAPSIRSVKRQRGRRKGPFDLSTSFVRQRSPRCPFLLSRAELQSRSFRRSRNVETLPQSHLLNRDRRIGHGICGEIGHRAKQFLSELCGGRPTIDAAAQRMNWRLCRRSPQRLGGRRRLVRLYGDFDDPARRTRASCGSHPSADPCCCTSGTAPSLEQASRPCATAEICVASACHLCHGRERSVRTRACCCCCGIDQGRRSIPLRLGRWSYRVCYFHLRWPDRQLTSTCWSFSYRRWRCKGDAESGWIPVHRYKQPRIKLETLRRVARAGVRCGSLMPMTLVGRPSPSTRFFIRSGCHNGPLDRADPFAGDEQWALESRAKVCANCPLFTAAHAGGELQSSTLVSVVERPVIRATAEGGCAGANSSRRGN